MKYFFTTLVFVAILMTAQAQTFTNYTADDGVIEGILADVIVDSDNNYWVVGWELPDTPGIGSFDGTNWQQFGIAEGAGGNRFRGVFQSSDSKFYFGNYQPIDDDPAAFDVFDGTTWTNYDVADGVVSEDVACFTEDLDGNIWIGALGGVSKFDGTTFTNYTSADSPGLLNVYDMLTDSDGNIWITSDSEGVTKFDGTNFTNYTTADGLISNFIFKVFQDDNGNFWFSSYTEEAGLSMFDGTTFTTITEADGLLDDRIRAINKDSDGRLYFGANDGISIFDGTNWTSLTEADGLLENHVRGIAEDDDGNMVFATFGGLSVYNPTLGIFQNTNPAFKIYPNPTAGTLHINSAGFGIAEVKIFNVLGELVETRKFNAEINQLSVSNLKTGIYLLQFTNAEGEHIVRKVVKE